MPPPQQKYLILAATPSPYFSNFYRRLVTELPGTQLHVLYSHARDVWNPQLDQPYHEQTVGRLKDYLADRSGFRLNEWVLGGQVCRLIDEQRPAAVVMLGYRDLCRQRVARWCHRQRIPVFAWSDINLRGDPSRGAKIAFKRRYVRSLDRKLNGWLVCGSMGEAYLERFGISADRIFRSPCEPDYVQIEHVTDAQIRSTLQELKLDPARRRIICSGRFVQTKRFDLVIRAFLAIADRRPDFDLVVLGQGPMESAWRSFVPPAFAHRVMWPGFLPDVAKVFALYRGCDVLAHLPEHEPWGLVVNEALCAGMAAVCSDVVGSAVELVHDGVNGLIVPFNNLAKTIDALLDVTDPQNLARYRSSSKPVLAAWRAAADPVEGFRRAMAHAGVIDCGKHDSSL